MHIYKEKKDDDSNAINNGGDDNKGLANCLPALFSYLLFVDVLLLLRKQMLSLYENYGLFLSA